MSRFQIVTDTKNQQWYCNILVTLLVLLLPFNKLLCQKMNFNYKPVEENSGFRMDGYWVWCGSMIRVGDSYHLFASRWPKSGPFPEGYRQNSEIVRATAGSPTGPFIFREVVIGERDSLFWDSNMAHNPTILKIGDEFVLFYIGSDFTTRQDNSTSLLRRVGYASSRSIDGPWKRSDEPVINTESNNPALLVDGNKILMVYRDAALRVFLARSDSYKGKYEVINDNLWPESRIEDFYLFKDKNRYHIICEDNTGGISSHIRWGVHLWSDSPSGAWKKYDPAVVYDHNIELKGGRVLKCNRRERPQLLITNNRITCLITSVYDGNNSWSQPVLLNNPIRIK